jgi:hypothetical protein
VTIYTYITINTAVAVHGPLVLYLGEDRNIKRLKLVGAFGREGEDKDAMLICERAELVSFMRVMAIKEEEDGVIV